MTTKEIILAGGSVSFSYKQKEKEWVGTAKIYGFSGGWGMKPHITVEVPTYEIAPGGRKEFEWNQIDEAISIFEKLVFRKENLCYKMTESMVELFNSGDTNLDLDIPEDLAKVRKLQKEKQNNEREEKNK